MPATKKSISLIDLVRLSLRIFKTKPLRTFLTILGMSAGIGTVVFLVSLGYGLQFILIGNLVTSQDSLITLSASYPAQSGLNIDSKTVQEIQTLPNVAETSSIAEFSGQIALSGTTGLLPTVRVAELNIFRLSGSSPDIGTPLREGEHDIVITNQALQLIGLPADTSSLGKEVAISIYSPQPDGTEVNVPIETPFSIVGIISDPTETPTVIIPVGSLPIAVNSFKEILVKAKDAATLVPLRDLLEKRGFIITANIDLIQQAEQITNVITIILTVFGLAALVVSAIGMFNTMLIGFLERTYEVGVMKSIGATDSNVRDLFLMESAVIGILGGSGGIILGLGLGKIINLGLNIIAGQAGQEPFTLFILPLWFGILVLVIAIFIGVVAGFLPAHRASELSPRLAFAKK
jgi:ABC-type antimicrobial peptide transport system permease subunit